METLKVITLCSGYDSQCLALERLKSIYPVFDYELVAWSEFDPESKIPLRKQPAVVAHNALFPQWSERNLGDMTKIDWNNLNIQCDLLFYSTPCQSISVAGLQHGFAEGSGTRSSIIWNVRDAVIALKPKYLCLENVEAMVGEKFIGMFNLWQRELERLGYRNFAQLMNAKDYGVPQNRERIFLVSIRVDDENNMPKYFFPREIKLKKRLKDLLEQNVDEKFYLNKEKESFFKQDGENFVDLKKVGTIYLGYVSSQETKHQQDRVFDINGCSPTISSKETQGRYLIKLDNGIRKLTQRECFRLMDVDDKDIDKIEASGISKTSQYQIAGNSIVVSCLYHIFRKMFIEKENESQQLSFDF